MKVFFLLFFIFTAEAWLYSQKNPYYSDKVKDVIDIEWENAEIIDHPVYGVLVLSKDRWKNWVFRSLIVIMVYISILIVLIAIPKTSDFVLSVCYVFCGSLFVISFWLSLCGWMLLRLGSFNYAWLFMALSLPMYAGAYFITLRIKKYDISYAEIKEEIRKIKEIEEKNYEDPRLSAVSGRYGEWEDEDFVRG